jgi:hypothetical protein
VQELRAEDKDEPWLLQKDMIYLEITQASNPLQQDWQLQGFLEREFCPMQQAWLFDVACLADRGRDQMSALDKEAMSAYLQQCRSLVDEF